ncbi:hypothetical protein MRBLMR1_004848 [Neorhizobium sp. LMR1-1-1.1]
MTDTTLNSMIAGFTVLEQIVIDLTHLVSSEFHDERNVRAGIVDHVRFRLESLQRIPSRETQSLACMALEHLDRLEPRIMGEDVNEILQ